MRRREPKADKPGPGGREESVGSSSSVPQPEPHVSTSVEHKREGGGPNIGNETVGASAAADESRPGWKSTASSSAKLILRGVRDSADAFGPLKSVAGGLCFILENYEVRYLSSLAVYQQHLHAHSEQTRTSRRSSRWHPEPKSLPNGYASPSSRVMSKNGREERDWNSEPILSADE